MEEAFHGGPALHASLRQGTSQGVAGNAIVRCLCQRVLDGLSQGHGSAFG
jgi:hypothetical protein